MALKLPILILGYERSGTTLLRRLVSMHPLLDYDLVHEKSDKLDRAVDRDDAIRRLTGFSRQNRKKTGGQYSIVSGLKRPYGGLMSVSRTVRKMQALFPETRILHILREPEEAISSQVRRFGRKFETCLNSYFDQVPRIMNFLAEQPDTKFVAFWQLTARPSEVLDDIFAWMGERVSEDFLRKILTTQDPWKHGDRVMPGLRYFDCVKRHPHKVELTAQQILDIRARQREVNWPLLVDMSTGGWDAWSGE